MERFRPPPVIEADRTLAEEFNIGSDAAIRTMVQRYGAPVTVLLDRYGVADRAPDVFVAAWVVSDLFEPGDEFDPWLRELTLEAAGLGHESADDVALWNATVAAASVDAELIDPLRARFVDGEAVSADAERASGRLERQLDVAGVVMLADERVWRRPSPDLADDVVAEIAGSSESSLIEGPRPSLLSRGVRPMLFGFAGALVVLLVAVIALSAASGSVEEPTLSVELNPTGAIAEVSAGAVTITERDAGLQFELDAATLPRRGSTAPYRLIAELSDGTEATIGSFNAGFDVTMTTGFELDRIAAVAVVAGEDVVLKAAIP